MAYAPITFEPAQTSIVEEATAVDVSIPTVSSGDLIMVFFASYHGAELVTPSGWTRRNYENRNSNQYLTALYFKVSDGTETTASVGVGAISTPIESFAALVGTVPASEWSGTLAGVETAVNPNNTDGTPTPPSLTPSWGAKDTLWLALTSYHDDAGTVTAFPSGYTQTGQAQADKGDNASAGIGWATRNLNAATEQPGTFTLSEVEGWSSITVAIEPAPAPPPASVTVTPGDLPLTPGDTISGSYSNYDTVPTTLTVSDGTNTITIASPTINDNGDGTGTFSGTMPALPTSGTASLILFGNVTVELT